MKHRNITDEIIRQALATEVMRSMCGDDIATVMEALINIHGAPEFVWIDNGAGMTSNTVVDWCRFSAADISFIDPGSPWQNVYVEFSNGRVRDEH